MPDREKVVKGLEHCPNIPFDLCYAECNSYDCPYKDELGIQKLHADATSLLKEQPEIVRCKDCKFAEKQICYPKEYEYRCLQSEYEGTYKHHAKDWFCADGIKR